jgi:hypothetical protein
MPCSVDERKKLSNE